MPIQRIQRPLDGQRLAGPFRPIDWRAQEALALDGENRVPSPRLHDVYVTTLTHYLRARRTSQTIQARSRLARRMPIPHKAVAFHEEAPEAARCMAQALTLANQPAELIGPRVGLPQDALVFYEKCYFDVRGRLGNGAFLMERVIGLPAAGTSGERFAAAAVKLLAWQTGPAAVELLMPARGDHGTSVADLAVKLARRTRLLMDVHTLGHDWIADPQRKRQVLEIIAAIEASPGPYGDESLPRNEAERLQAQKTLFDRIVLDRLHGPLSPNRGPDHV